MTIRAMSTHITTLRRLHRLGSITLTDDQQATLLRRLHDAYRGDLVDQTPPYHPPSTYLLPSIERDPSRWN